MSTSYEVHIKGSEQELRNIIANIESISGDEEINITSPKPTTDSPNPFSRTGHRQIELFEVVIAIGINLASSAIYDAVKTYLQEIQDKEIVQVEIIDDKTKNANDAEEDN